MRDDSKKSVTAGARGERAIITPRPAPRLAHRSSTEPPPGPPPSGRPAATVAARTDVWTAILIPAALDGGNGFGGIRPAVSAGGGSASFPLGGSHSLAATELGSRIGGNRSVSGARRPEGQRAAPAGPVPPGANRLTRSRIFLARAAAVAGLLALATLAAPRAAAQTDVWTATLTPGDFGSGLIGCNNASAIATRKCSTATVLSDDDFTYDSTDYSVTTLFVSATAFTFTLDTDITAATNALTVVVGGTSLALADATNQTARKREWFNPGFSWTAGTTVSIRFTGPTPMVPPDWSLKPTGLAEGSQFRLLFLSSTKRDATATDIADYNTFVQDRAEAGHIDIQGYSAGFRAVGCTADSDARDNTATTGTGVPIYWLNGTKAADDYGDFYDESWDDEANDKNESGTNGPDTSQQANYPFTGCEDNGTEATFNVNSVALGGPAGLGVRVGRPNSSATGDGPISGSLNETKTNTRPMYGLSAVFQVLVVPPSLTSAVVLADGNTIQLAFSEDLQSANLPPAAAFTVTAGGTAVTVTGVAAGSTEDVLEITVSPLIGQGQAVVVAYADPTAGDDAKAIQDTVGNDTPDFTTGSGDVPAVTNNSALTNEVLASWSLTPAGLAVGTRFRLLFLSSTKRDALSSDIADYNTFVQDRAAAGHAAIQAYSGGFGAIGCTSAVDARDNTSTTGTGVPIYWLDGAKVADDYADFYDGSWDDEINDKNESGADAHDTSQAANYPITGCMDDGTESFAGATRPRSLGAPLGLVRIGRLNASGSVQDPIDGNDNARTNLTRPMYGLSAVFEVSSSPSTNPSVPAAISDVAVVPEPRTTDSLRVSWTAPDNTGKPALTGYFLRYKSDADAADWTFVSHAGASTSVIVDALDENEYYFVEVRAVNAEYSGPWSVTAEGATTPVPEVVLANHPLVPADLGPGDSFRLLHVTSNTTAATGTGIHDYNYLVTVDIRRIVSGGNLLGLWVGGARLSQRALVSTAGADARLHTDATWTGTDRGVPIYWVNGARVADDYPDFYDGAWADEANPMNGFGESRSVAGAAPWTGTGHDGTELFEGGVSRAMGQASVGVGALDSAVPGAGPLNGGAAFASTEERPLYALWHVMVIDENLRLAGNLNSAFAPGTNRDSDERAAVRAQLFTTGSHPGGYGISEIVVRKGFGDVDGFLGDVAIHTTDGDGDPDLADGLHATLSLESTDSNFWYLEAPEGTVLEASTTYALVLEGKAGAYPKLATNSADGEDAVAAGWSLGDVLRYHDGSNWVDNPDGYALTMDIIGPLAAVTTEVPADWGLIPTGVTAGDKFRLLFLSSTKRDAVSSDIADYNTFVQTRAAAGHTDIQAYSAGFTAVGCTSAVDARDNTSTTYTASGKGVPIYWLNGAKAADEYEDFYDGSWDDEANDKNESGSDAHDTSMQSNFPSTGCNHDGTEAFQAGDSIALGGSDVRLGRPNSTGSGHGPISSDRHRRTDVTFTNPLYGLSGLFRVARDTAAPELTSATVSESGGNIALVFSEDLHAFTLPPATAFTVTAGGTAVMVTAVALGTTPDAVQITVSPLIGQGQAVVVEYDDPTAGDDTNAIQDGVGNDTPDFTTGSGGVPAVTNDSTAANAVLAGWSLTPTGLAVGAQFRLLFLSSTKRDAVSTDIADYNTFVQTRAAAGHTDIRDYSAGFRVVGCTADTDARDNTSTTFTTEDKGVPIYWLNGAKAADEYEDFYDGDWDDEANDKNESGSDGFDTSQISNFPLTGCTHEGTEKFTVINLSQALGSTEFNPAIGRPNSSSGGNGPLSSTSSASPLARPMYGLSAVFQVADAPDTTPPTLTSADVEETNGLTIYLEFSEDLQLSNPPLASAFTLTVDGSAVTGFSVAVPGSLLPQNAIWLHPPTAIRQGQAVVVTYTDPTGGNDTAAIQDTAGNDTPDFTTGMNSVPAVTNNSTVPTAVPNNWGLKPTGLNTGDQFRLLFLSSTKRNASATAIADYNTFVQTRAAAGHTDIRDYSAGFRVVGCTADTDARDNTATTYISTAKGVPIYWLDGTKAADEYEDFYDGDWDDEANDKNESGTDGPDTSQQANYPWTGCNHDGTEATGFGGVSRGLGSTTGNLVRFGRPNSSNANHGPLSGAQNFSKTQTRPLYGLSAVFQVAAAVVINNPPAFSGSTAARSVAENTAAGQNVGAALTATDLDGHTLIYTLEGTDAASFDIALRLGTDPDQDGRDLQPRSPVHLYRHRQGRRQQRRHRHRHGDDHRHGRERAPGRPGGALGDRDRRDRPPAWT